MTLSDILSDLPLGPGDSREALLQFRLQMAYLADHVYSAELADGGRVRDAIDFAQWLRDLADETRKRLQNPESTKVSLRQELSREPKVATCRNPQPRYQSEFCNICGHVHIDDTECGFPTGAGGREPCRCDRKVTA
jgi:hypothetical protein